MTPIPRYDTEVLHAPTEVRPPDVGANASAGRDVPKQMGRYEIVCKLAVGGMAEIFLARRRAAHGFAKHVVIKRILAHYAADPRFVQMFLDEARLAAKLQHPNIGQVYDIGQHDDTYFFAMEYLHGADVRAICRAAGSRGTRVPLEHSLAIITGVAAGLHYAHEQTDEDGAPLNLVHRDVSPSNIIVTYDGIAKLVDFGIARATTRQHETHTGHLRGKLAYMSPEQCKRQRLDRRADIFALGVVLYELTTGQRLFRHGDESDYLVMTRIVHGEVPPPSAVTPGYPAALETITMRALATDRERRYATAGELLADLQAFVRAERLASSPAALARCIRELTGDDSEPWREGFDAEQLDKTRDEVSCATEATSSTDNAPPPAAERPTADIHTRVLRAPRLPTLPDEALATIDEQSGAVTRAHPRSVLPRAAPASPTATRPVVALVGAVVALIVGALVLADDEPRAVERTPVVARSAPVVEALATPIVVPLDAAVPAPTPARSDPPTPTPPARPQVSPTTTAIPTPTVTALASPASPSKRVTPTRKAKRGSRARSTKRERDRTRRHAAKSKSKRKARASSRARAKAKPAPAPEENREWNADSPLLPSRAN